MIHGLNRHYYSININYRKNELEQKMLQSLHKRTWTHGLRVKNYDDQAKETETTMKVHPPISDL